MTLAIFEARRLVRSPILWIGVVLVIAGGMVDINAFWPMLEGNDLIAHDLSLWLMGFAALAAGWLGLRDRRTGAESLVRVTPADGRAVIVPARIAALLAACVASFALVFGASLAVSAVRGGHGTPDLRLYLDGAMLVALGASMGYAVGFLTGSRVASLLVAPGLPALSQLLLGVAFVHPQEGAAADWAWLLPSVYEPQRSVTFGFLPDIWSGHIAWLLALVTLVCGGVTLLAARRAAARRALLVSTAAVAMGALLAVASGAWLMARPWNVVVFGPHTTREMHRTLHDQDFQDFDRLARASGPWPDDGHATECVTRYGFEVCVYQEFGESYARILASAYGRQARLLSGLDVFPTRARMVPSHWASDFCTPEEVLVFEMRNPPDIVGFDSSLVQCVWTDSAHPSPEAEDARSALMIWLFAESRPDLRDEVAGGRIGFGDQRATRAGLAMAEMPPEEVRAALAPLWDELKRGTLPLSALPGESQ